MGSVGTQSLKSFAPFIALVAVCLTGSACTRPTPGYCGGGGGARNCKNGQVCNTSTRLCESTDAAAETAPGSDARDANDADAPDGNAEVPFRCTGQAACASSDAGHACFVDAGTCVECVVPGDCKTANQPICDSHACRGCTGSTDCTTLDAGHACFVDAGACVECVANGDCTAATRPVCQANACRGCAGNTECATPDAGHACFVDAGTCVECVADADCKTVTLPICEGHACRACKADSECPDPGICLEDGHCATAGEVVFVEYRATGCPGAGSSANPFCAPADAVATTTTHPVIVIRGPANNQMTLDTTTPVVVVGKKNAAGVAPSIPAGAATGITVAAGNVLVRDLSVTAGSAPSAKGIVLAGTAVRLRLLRVGVSLGMGLGVEADAGELDMNRCTVTGNSGGGILVNGAGYDITNTVVAANGPNSVMTVWGGVYLQKAPLGSKTRFLFNTVVNNLQVGIVCGDAYPIGASILRGNVGGVEATANCVLTACCPGVDPLLTADYHLMSGSPCIAQVASSMLVADDLDGQARPATLSDCGADQR